VHLGWSLEWIEGTNWSLVLPRVGLGFPLVLLWSWLDLALVSLWSDLALLLVLPCFPFSTVSGLSFVAMVMAALHSKALLI
jgi:hypothetical protein